MMLDTGAAPDGAALSPYAAGLSTWYERTPGVRCLWAIDSTPSAGPAALERLRVVLMLEPAGDGGETSIVWMARGRTWQQELRAALACAVDLEWLDEGDSDELEIDGDGTVVVALCWRDPTSSQA